MNARTTCYFSIAAAALLCAPVAHAQSAAYFGSAIGVSSPTIEANEDKGDGLIVAPLGGTGLNTARAGNYGSGLRLLPDSGAFIGYQMGNWTIGSALHRDNELELARDTRLDLGASYGLNLNRKHSISVDGGISVRTARDWDTNHPAYAFNVGESAEPGAGFRLSWRYNFDRNHYLSTTLGYDHRLSTPLHEGPDAERGAATFGTVYGYRFW